MLLGQVRAEMRHREVQDRQVHGVQQARKGEDRQPGPFAPSGFGATPPPVMTVRIYEHTVGAVSQAVKDVFNFRSNAHRGPFEQELHAILTTRTAADRPRLKRTAQPP